MQNNEPSTDLDWQWINELKTTKQQNNKTKWLTASKSKEKGVGKRKRNEKERRIVFVVRGIKR
jgi:hypothetical protein